MAISFWIPRNGKDKLRLHKQEEEWNNIGKNTKPDTQETHDDDKAKPDDK